MKAKILLMVLSLMSLISKGQDSKDRELVYKVILEFQNDFNEFRKVEIMY